MAGSKCYPRQGQWALKLESCSDVIKTLFSTAMAGQDNVLALKAFSVENGCNAGRYSACDVNFEPNRLDGVVVKHIGAGGFGFDFWAGTGR